MFLPYVINLHILKIILVTDLLRIWDNVKGVASYESHPYINNWVKILPLKFRFSFELNRSNEQFGNATSLRRFYESKYLSVLIAQNVQHFKIGMSLFFSVDMIAKFSSVTAYSWHLRLRSDRKRFAEFLMKATHFRQKEVLHRARTKEDRKLKRI